MSKQKRPLFKNMTDEQLLNYYSLMLFQQQIAGLAAKTFDHELARIYNSFAIGSLQNVQYAASKRGINLEECVDRVSAALHSPPVQEVENEEEEKEGRGQ